MSEWHISSTIDPPNDLPEIKTTLVTVETSIEFDMISFTEKFDRYVTLIRFWAYVRRLLADWRPHASLRKGPITTEEFTEAKFDVIKNLQRRYFPEAFSDQLKPSALLNSLNAFLDKEGVLRVGGRLKHSSLPYERKFPILLPNKSYFAKLVVDHHHLVHCHANVSALQAIIRTSYWIPSDRSLIRHRIFKCLKCFKSKKLSSPPFMGNLPSSRFSEVRPFYKVGVDFAGPFSCRESNRRNAHSYKTYLCLFICLSTKAMHLEVCTALSTESFLNALDRLIYRRGVPSLIVSDCGTNFVGAANYLRDIYAWFEDNKTHESIINYVSSKGVKWTFNPPYSPHFGGIWEAGVKSTKSLLTKVLGSQTFTLEELNTMLVKIEGVLNSRPLVPLSSDPSDLQALTPGHFIIGQPLTSLPESDYTSTNLNRLNRWELLRERTQHFWSRWKLEYLNTLQQRQKWCKLTPNLKIGDLVIIRDRQTPPLHWPLARVIETHPGEDQIVRVVSLQTSKGIIKRSVVNLVPLTSITSPNSPNLSSEDASDLPKLSSVHSSDPASTSAEPFVSCLSTSVPIKINKNLVGGMLQREMNL